MSQVIRKFENSGKIEQSKPELFERSGVGKYNKADLVAGLYRNIDTYIKNNNLSGDKAVSFRDSANQFIKGIENGTISMNGDGTFSDATGSMASTGKFDKNWIGRKKDTTNNAFNLVGDYALDYINQMQQYTEPAAKPKSKFNTNDFLTKEISKRWYGGNDIDFGNWFKNRSEQDRNALLGDIFNNADYNQLYQDYDWTDTGINSAEDLATRGRAFSTAISNNTLDNDDYNTFATLGGSGLDKFLKEAPVQTEPTPEQSKMKAWEAEAKAAGATTPEAISAFIKGKQQDEENTNRAIIERQVKRDREIERDTFFNDYATRNPFKGTISGYVASNTTYNPEKQNEFISAKYGDNYGGFVKYMQAALNPKYFRGELKQMQGGNDVTAQHLANNLDMAIQSGYLDDLGDGNYGIPGTYNYDNWSFVSYNPSTKQYKETSMLANDSYKKLLAHPEYDKRHPAKKENGGVVKFQSGGDTKEAAYLKYRQQFAKKKEEKKQQIQAKAKATDRTPEQVEAGERKPMADGQDWEYEDYARLVSAGADVGSMIASFVPGYGTAASAALGVGSTIGNFTADLADESVGVGSAFLNAGAGLGMDLIGLIPGLGAAGKGSKIVKNLLKVAPKLITIWSASTSFAPAMQAFNKLKDKGAKEMTVDDWKALANGLTAAAGATRWGAAAAKNKINTHKYGTTTRTVTTKSGKQVQMSEEEFQRIKRASGIEGQNEALQAVEGAKGEQLPTTFKKWYDVRRAYQGTPDVDKNTVINTDAMRRTAPDGTILEPTKFSNQGIWRGAVNNDWGHNWKGWKGPKWLKDWGYAPVKKEVDPKTVNEAVDAVSSIARTLHTASRFKPAPLALPAPGQATPSNRVFVMGSGKPNTPRDVTNPSNLRKPGSYIDRAVPVGGTPVESPNANAVRTVKTINSILEPFVSQPRNLPAVIPASRNANKVVASQTIQPTQRLDQFIEGQIPGGRQFRRQRAKTEREYRDVFHPAAEREYNQVWDEAVRGKKDFGYEEVFPKRSPYAPPTPTEVYVTPGETVKDPNARYLWELINKKPSTAHVKRDNPPRKAKPKKKKTSKDDRVTKKAEGGVVQFLQGGNTVGRIKAKDMSNWNRANALANYDWIADYDRWASQHEGPDDVVDSYILAFNGGEDIYDQLTSKTGDYFGGKYNYSVQDPLAKHRQITFRGTNQGFDDLIRKGIVGYGTTEGDSGFDIYAGDRTGNRTLARGMSPEDVARFNKQLATRGMELYDKGNGAYRLRRLEQKPVELPEVVVTADTPKTPATTNPSAIKGAAPKKGKGFNLGVMPEDVIALGRMVGGLAANNRAAKLYKEGLKPTLLDTFENTVPLQGNFQATTNAEQQAGNLESVAARPRTSDASLQLAGELEASGRAGQARFQGGLQDAEMFYKTRMLGQQESDAAKARRVDVANRNRASMNQIDAAKKQIDAARVTSNYQNVIAPYLAGVENQFAQKRAMNQQLDMEEAQREAERTYSPEFDRLTQDHNNAYKAYGAANNNNYTGWETSNEYKSLVSRRKSLNDNVSQFLLDKRRGIMGSPYMFQVKKNSSIKTPYVKSGGKLSAADREKLQRAKDFNKRLLEDNKQFHKDIMESKREHNKLIMSMSSLTSELIKKAMS
jgi:hypothetical protein